MKCIYTLFIFIIPLLGQAQNCNDCTINLIDNLPEDTIYISVVPDATVGEYYEESISFRLPRTTDPVAANDPTVTAGITLDAITITSFTNLPTGFEWTPNQETYDLPEETDGCITLCGLPLVAGQYEMKATLTAQVSIITQNTSFTIMMNVLPAVSSTVGFDLINNSGCGSVEAAFENNIPSNGNEGYSYFWQFDNGLNSNLENPPTQTYDTPGTYYIDYEAIIDTIGFILTQVEVMTASCDDVSIPLITNGNPELYIRIKDENNVQIYESSFLDDTNAPVTFDLNLPMSEGNYTLEIWDEDGGIDGQDDNCGNINFNRGSNGLSTNGDVSAIFNIIHPTTTITARDSIVVFPIPEQPIIETNAPDILCDGERVILSVSNYSENIEWYQDSSIIANGFELDVTETGQYWAIYTDENGCSETSETLSFNFTGTPNAPVFSNDNNQLSLFEGVELPNEYQLQWYVEDEILEGETSPFLCAEMTGNYTLEILDIETGCSNNFSALIFWDDNFDCTTSTDEVAKTNIDVFPNPFNEVIFVESDEAILYLKLWNSMGQLVWNQSIPNTQRFEMSTFFLENGFYILEVETKAGSQFQKLVKE